MQPVSASAASTGISGFRRYLRPRDVMGGASLLSIRMSVTADLCGRRLVAVVDLIGIHHRGVVAAHHHDIERIADGRGLAVDGARGGKAYPAHGIGCAHARGRAEA